MAFIRPTTDLRYPKDRHFSKCFRSAKRTLFSLTHLTALIYGRGWSRFAALKRCGGKGARRSMAGSVQYSRVVSTRRRLKIVRELMRVAFDIGGTFTDVMVFGDDGQLTTAKVLSLLDRVGEDIVACVRQASTAPRVENFVHGTTIAANAVIENKLAVTGLLTTQGFRDELEMRGQRRPNIYDAEWDRLAPLVPRELRLEVNERILGNGAVERAPNAEEVRAAIKNLLAQGVEALAVCFINSYLNATHEQQVGKLIAEIAPQTVVCLSSDIHPEIREYERMSTTAINAALIPVVNHYMDRLERHLSTYSDKLLIMQSNGGIMTAQSARRRPIYTIESGPAAGVLAAARLAVEAGAAQTLSLDMGGTTAKACLIERGVPLEKPGGEIGGGATV